MNTLFRLLFALVLVTPAFARAYTGSYYAASSRLASGRWVKIEADTTGIYELSHDQLREWGFANPSEVCVYGYGAVTSTDNTFSSAYPDDMVQTASMHTSDGRLLFYAESDVRATAESGSTVSFKRNYYDTRAVYYLSDSGEREAMPVSEFKPDAVELDWHYCIDLKEREIQCPGEGGVIYHSRRLNAGESERYTFHIRDFGNSGSRAYRGYFRYEAGVNTTRSTRLSMKFSDNLWVIENNPSASGTNSIPTKLFVSTTGDAEFAASVSKPLNDTYIDVDMGIPPTFTGNYAAIDRVYMIYPRYNRLNNDSELMLNIVRSSLSRNILVSGADDDVCFWNVTDPTAIRSYETSRDALSHTAAATLGMEGRNATRMVVFNPGATHRKPRFAGMVANQDIHGSLTPDMLIVTTQSLLPAARELADIHRTGQGIDVEVFTQEQVYNEFSSGVRTPTAIRRLLKMYYDRDPEKIRYLLLYGATNYDMRGLVLPAADNLVTFECEIFEQARETSTNYASDQFFGMLADDYDPQDIGHMHQQISVGRLPVADLATARAMNEKSRAWLSRTPSAATFLRTLKFSDDGDNSIHFNHSEELVDSLLSGNKAITVTRADNLLYPWTNDFAVEASKKIGRALARGTGFMYYTGHGSASGLTGQRIYDKNFIDSHRYQRQPLVLLSSCDAYPFDRESSALIEKMVFSPRGGAIGAIGACRPVYLDLNRPLSLAVARAYAASGPGDTGADVFRHAREILISDGMGKGLGYNTLCYNYCGDPALPVSAPSYGIKLTSVGGKNISSGFELPSMEPVKIEGMVTGINGKPVDTFCGPVLIEVYDAPSTLTTLRRDSEDGKPVEVSCDENLLAEYGTVASNGRFSTTVVLPAPCSADGLKRIVITANDSISKLTAAGVVSDAVILDAPDFTSSALDTSAPEILEFSIDPSDFNSPSTVGPEFTVNAVIDPSATGLATGNAGIRAGLSVTVDNSIRLGDATGTVSYGNDGLAHISVDIPALSLGRHTVTLKAVNNAGEASTAEIVAFVATPSLSGVLSAEGADPARTEVEFSLDCGTDAEATLIINDASGNTVHRKKACTFPYSWNLRDDKGHRVGAGHYKAWAVLEDDISLGSTGTVEIVVLKQ